MNLLHISQILPIPGYYNTNDFVFKFSDYFLLRDPESTVLFIRPVPITNKILKKYLQVISISLPQDYKDYQYNSHFVKVIKFLSVWHYPNLHALSSISAYWFNRKFLFDFIRRNNIHVIHAQFIFPDGILAMLLKRKFNIPYILTTHTELRYFRWFISRRLALSVLNNAYRITPLNYQNIQLFLDVGLKKAEILPLGIDKKFLASTNKNTVNPEFRIITVSELIPLKNIDKVLRVLSILKQKYSMRYTIIGQGPEEENLKGITRSLGINDLVEFMGYVEHDKLPEILFTQDLFIMPSFPETFGRVYFEAMGAGLPVICSINSGIYGYFSEEVDKYAVNPDNLQDIVEKIEWFILNSEARLQIGKELRKRMQSFTWEKITERLHQIYNDALATNNNNQ